MKRFKKRRLQVQMPKLNFKTHFDTDFRWQFGPLLQEQCENQLELSFFLSKLSLPMQIQSAPPETLKSKTKPFPPQPSTGRKLAIKEGCGKKYIKVSLFCSSRCGAAVSVKVTSHAVQPVRGALLSPDQGNELSVPDQLRNSPSCQPNLSPHVRPDL